MDNKNTSCVKVVRDFTWKKPYCWVIVLIPVLYFIGAYSFIGNEQSMKVGGEFFFSVEVNV